MELKPVNFIKPNIALLKKEGYMCVDAHCHTSFSDGTKLASVLDVCRKKGIGLAVTDHNEIRGAVEASKQNEVTAIPGIEINTIDGPHFLCYFYDASELEQFYERFIQPKKFFNMRSMVKLGLLDVIDRLEKFNCIKCLPHPYAPLWANINKVLIRNPENRAVVESVDAIEVISGLQRKTANRKAHALQILFDKSPTGGSDAHGTKELGNCLTLARAENVEEFLDSIRKKKTIAIGTEKMGQKAAHTTRMLRRNSKRMRQLIRNSLLQKNEIS